MAIDPFLSKCIAILKQSEVQREVKDLVKPLLDMMLNELYPYIYLSVLLVLVSFFLILGIFILLLRNKMLFYKKT